MKTRTARPTQRTVALLTAVAAAITLLPPIPVTAYTGDDSNPGSCSSPTTLVQANIIRSGVTVGRVQLRFSDPCNTSWSRTCATSGYTILNTGGLGDTGGERFIAPSSVGFFYSEKRQGTGSDNCGLASLTGGSDYSVAWFNDCIEAGLGTCKSRSFGAVAKGGYSGFGNASE